MIINDDPIPMKRLRAAAKKAGLETPLKQKIKQFTKTTKISLSTLNVFASVIMMTGILTYVTAAPQSTEQSVAQSTDAVERVVMTAMSKEEATYRACLFEKHPELTDVSRIDDPACHAVAYGPSEEELREAHLEGLLAGHPMEVMAPALASADPEVAAFIVGIGKIESNWGKRSPAKDGVDCYNYWGYKTTGSRGQALGYACFSSPQEAVETIATRLHLFVHEQGRDTAEKLLVWKCGRSCATHSREGVARWVSVVQTYSDRALAVDPESLITALKLSRK